MHTVKTVGLSWLMGLLLLPSAGAADEPASPQPIIGKPAIGQALEKKVTIDLVDKSLPAALRALGQQMAVPIEIDQQPVEAYGETHAVRITTRAVNIPARTALQRMLLPVGLDWLEEPERILVTTAAKAQAVSQTVRYDVTDLALRQDSQGQWCDHSPALAAMIRQLRSVDAEDGAASKGDLTVHREPAATVFSYTACRRRQAEVARFLAELRRIDAARRAASPGRMPQPTAEQLRHRKFAT